MIKKNITGFEQAVDYLYEVPRFTTKNTPEDTRRVLKLLGSPDREMTIIHVAGTNGKGSVCTYMRSILEAAGRKVALFTSPHLVDIRERFMIGGEMIGREEFLSAFLKVYESLDWQALERGEGYHPSYFEFLFFIAMIVFGEAKPDYCILETGLGGRLDATNAVEHKALTVITRISRDHTEYLGDTVTQIAGEKAGIMSPGVPVVFTDAEDAVSAVFCEKAKGLSAECFPVSKDDYAFLNFKNKIIDFSYHSRYDKYIELSLQTTARYQMENCALAVRAIEVLDQNGEISEEMIRAGVRQAFWAGRMEEVLPGVFVDGAHNEDGVRAFLDSVSMDMISDDGEHAGRILLFSVVADKDYEKMLSRIAGSGLFDRIILAHLDNYRAAGLESMGDLLKAYPECCVEAYPCVADALQRVLELKKPEEHVYIAGSLYLVGEIKELLGR